ncbi:hypothetical protein FRB99_000832 [Tulasnella sp. 403]|nr:hypothetical protein FRB99_000832 [Tulasnella sp. 403]
MDESRYTSPESTAYRRPPMPRGFSSATNGNHSATHREPTSDSGPETLGGISRQNTTVTFISGSVSSTMASTKATSYDTLHIEIPRQFGETDEYWEQYNQLADHYDKERVRVLNNTLDTLLIFVSAADARHYVMEGLTDDTQGALFSAVTTSFIIYYLPKLEPPPDAHTIALLKLIALGRTNLTDTDLEPPPFVPERLFVRGNCWLVLSLCLSLLASFAALTSKQAVLHFARDYPSTLEEHGRWHQRKLRIVDMWQFQTVVEGLPLLLIIALIVFFIGVIDGLRVIGTKALTLLMAVFGISFCAIFLLLGVVAILFPESPYQIPLTNSIRGIGTWCWRPVSQSQIWDEAQKLATNYRDALFKWDRRGRKSDGSPLGDSTNNTMDTHTASWVLERSGQKDILISTARNIPALRTIKGTRLCPKEPGYVRLESFFKDALAAWNMSSSHGKTTDRMTSDLRASLIYGRALVHCAIGGRSAASRDEEASPSRVLWPKWETSSANELLLIKLCLGKNIPDTFCFDHPKDTFPVRSAALHIYLAAILEPSPHEKRFRISTTGLDLDRITLIQWLASMSLAHLDNVSPITLNTVAWSLGNPPNMILGTEDGFTKQHRDDWWNAYTSWVDRIRLIAITRDSSLLFSEKNLHKNVAKALERYDHHQKLQSALQRMGEPAQSRYWTLLGPENYEDLYRSLLRKFIDTRACLHELHNSEVDQTLERLRSTVFGGHTIEETINEVIRLRNKAKASSPLPQVGLRPDSNPLTQGGSQSQGLSPSVLAPAASQYPPSSSSLHVPLLPRRAATAAT